MLIQSFFRSGFGGPGNQKGSPIKSQIAATIAEKLYQE
jgi:hypothetical protein